MKRLLASNGAEEARAQGVLLDRLEAAFSKRIQAEIVSASRSMIDEYSMTGSDPAMPMMHFSRMNQIYADMAGVTIAAFGGRVMDAAAKLDRIELTEDGKGVVIGLETKAFEELFAMLAEVFVSLEAVRQRIAAVSEHTRNQIIDMIAKGQRDGLGTEAIARMISEKVPGIARVRARVIARTETHGAANYGAFESAKATGVVARKEWLSVHDRRTRDAGQGDGVIDEYDHRSMDGQIVAMDQPFLMPWRKGDPLHIQHPGEAGMPGGAVINCRCAVAYVVD